MAESKENRTDKGLYICPNNHMYNANKYGDTCPNCGAKQQDKNKTPEENEKLLTLHESDYVCGFLICLKGINKGNFYPFYAAKNFIGSDPNMDICIKGDPQIEKINHAVIAYDSFSRKTVLLANISQGMVYVNKEASYKPMDLNPFDRLEIGQGVYMLLELCGSDFDWKDLANL